MQTNCIGMKISIFCLAFLCGFLPTEWLTERNDKINLSEVRQTNSIKTNKNFRVVEFKQSLAKLPCKRFSNHSDLNILLKELDKLNRETLEETKSFRSEKSTRRKLQKAEKEIKSSEDKKEETIEEFRVRIKSAKKTEQIAAQTLFHIKDCVEYNNLR